MIALDEAVRLLTDAAAPLPAEQVALDAAHGRVLAEEVTADRDYPPTDRSAMDGFAVRSQDLPRPGETLRISSEVRAGQAAGDVKVEPGTAVRVFTGAVVPPGADAVVMVERTREDRAASSVTIDIRPEPGEHIRPQAQDLKAGQAVLAPGGPIHAPELAALASVGRTTVGVHRLPRVHVLSTGDEVVEPQETPAPHQVRNSNAITLMAQLRESGIEGRYLGIARDSEGELARMLQLGLCGDLLLVTGGVSVGDYDLVGRSLQEAGMHRLFHGVAVKPGKPILAGRHEGCLVVGLPGNPVSAYCGFAVFVAPALRRLMGFRRWANLEVRATLAAPLRSRPGRTTYHLARIAFEDGAYRASPVRTTGSGDVLSMVRANGFVVTGPEAGDREAGTELPSLLWHHAHLRL